MDSKSAITGRKRRLGTTSKGMALTLNQQVAGSNPASPSQKRGFCRIAGNDLTCAGLFLAKERGQIMDYDLFWLGRILRDLWKQGKIWHYEYENLIYSLYVED